MPHALTIDDVLALREFPIICGPQFDFDPAGERLAFCLPGSRAESARFFLDAIGGGEGELYIVDLATSHIRRLPALDDLGVLSPVWSPDGTRIALAVTDGISLRPAVIDVESGAMRVVSERNLTLPGTRTFFHWLDDAAPSRSFLMPFVTAAGEKTQLRCILPPDYQEGQKRPAVLWVYPGFKAGSDMAHRQDPLNQPGMFNLHLLAARGFVVIIPSMPYDEAALGDRVLADCLTDSTRPACGAVVEAGYVDPERIHVAGHSLGGWATLVLLTKTKEFRSGIALAGSSNLLSQTDDVRLRFDTIVDDSRSPGLADNYHLSEPPWKALDQYLRNSPLFSVEDIAAPVLMIHGDQDYVEIGQSEQMFAALRSLGKPAEFVRYWGEGHVLESPANIRDAWERILAWLEKA